MTKWQQIRQELIDEMVAKTKTENVDPDLLGMLLDTVIESGKRSTQEVFSKLINTKEKKEFIESAWYVYGVNPAVDKMLDRYVFGI